MAHANVDKTQLPAPLPAAFAPIGPAPFKLTFRKDTRRWTPPARLTYEALVESVRSAFELPVDRELRLTYTDVDDDQVSLVGEEDMRELYLQSLPIVRVAVALKNGKRDCDEVESAGNGAWVTKKQKHAPACSDKHAAWRAKLEMKAANGNPKAQAKLAALRGGNQGKDECVEMLSKLTVGTDGTVASGPTQLWKAQRVSKFLDNLAEFLPRIPTRQPALTRVTNMLNNACDKVDDASRDRVVKALTHDARRHPAVLAKLRLMAGPDSSGSEAAILELRPMAKQMVLQAADRAATGASVPSDDAASMPAGSVEVSDSIPKIWKPHQVDNFLEKLNKFLPCIARRQPALVKVANMLNKASYHVTVDATRARLVKTLAAAARRDSSVMAKLTLIAGPGVQDEPAVPELLPMAKEVVLQAVEVSPSMECDALVGDSEDDTSASPKASKPHQVDNFLEELSKFLPRIGQRQPALAKVANMLNNKAPSFKADTSIHARVVKTLITAARRDGAVMAKLALIAGPGVQGEPAVPELLPAAKEVVLQAVGQAQSAEYDAPMGEPEDDTSAAPKLWQKPHQVDNFLEKLNKFLPRIGQRQPALDKVGTLINKCQYKADAAANARIRDALSLAAKQDPAVLGKLRLLATAPHMSASAQAMIAMAVKEVSAQSSAPPANANIFDNAAFV